VQELGKNFYTRKTFYDSLSPDEVSEHSATENETEFRNHEIKKFIVILRGCYKKGGKNSVKSSILKLKSRDLAGRGSTGNEAVKSAVLPSKEQDCW
jgi:hypothetical protein